jgi:DNA-binding transcriptional LysR family regulator
MDRIRRIELFVRAAEAGGFARAANSLSITPSAVSHAIADLEKNLGVPLFHRTTRQLRLTAEGEDIYLRGCELLRQVGELEASARKTPERITGTLRVGLPIPLSSDIVMPNLKSLVRRQPHLRVEFFNMMQPKDMHAEGVDVLVRIGEPPVTNLVARKIAQIRHGVYASPEYLAAAGVPQRPEDLPNFLCLAIKVATMSRPLEEWTFERGKERKVINVAPQVVAHDRQGIIAAVLAGVGLMRLGCFDPSFISSGRLQRVLPEWTCPAGFPIYAMYRRSASTSPKIQAFLGFLEESFALFDPGEVTLFHRGNEVRPPAKLRSAIAKRKTPKRR